MEHISGMDLTGLHPDVTHGYRDESFGPQTISFAFAAPNPNFVVSPYFSRPPLAID
jgi:hypothetical protein